MKTSPRSRETDARSARASLIMLCAALLAATARPASAWNMHFSTLYTDHYTVVKSPVVLDVQFCADKEVMDYVNSKNWPGQPIPVSFTWAPVSANGSTGLAYGAWAGQKPTLPATASLWVALPDGGHGADVKVKATDFPAAGKWQVTARLPKQFSLSCPFGLIEVASVVQKGGLLPQKAVTPIPPAAVAERCGTVRESGGDRQRVARRAGAGAGDAPVAMSRRRNGEAAVYPLLNRNAPGDD